jgi:hypothetical protein
MAIPANRQIGPVAAQDHVQGCARDLVHAVTNGLDEVDGLVHDPDEVDGPARDPDLVALSVALDPVTVAIPHALPPEGAIADNIVLETANARVLDREVLLPPIIRQSR